MSENQKKESESLSDKLNKVNSSEKLESIIDYAKSNTIDTIAYVLLIIGILWIFFESFYGSILVGVVFGIYFSEEISTIVKNTKGFITEHGLPRSVVLAGAALALFIALPGFFIGTAIAVALKELFTAGSRKK